MANYNAGHGARPQNGQHSGAVAHSPSYGLNLQLAQAMDNGGQAMAVDADVFDPGYGLEGSLLDGMHGFDSLPFPHAFNYDTFSPFDDRFPGPPPRLAYEMAPDSEPVNADSPSQEVDNKMLVFSAPTIKAQLVDSAGHFADAHVTAELLGMFFVAEDVFGGGDNNNTQSHSSNAGPSGAPQELTCYRRNLWQCSGQIILPRALSYAINEQGQHLPVFELAAAISAVESIDGKPTEIISIPWKSSPIGGEEPKAPAPPPTLPLDLSSGQDIDHNRVALPVSWKRLQFKHATANNGRRKGVQQHYLVQVSLLSKMPDSGQYVKLAEIQSGPVIVRGRSPRNFDKQGKTAAAAGSSTTNVATAKTEKGAEVAPKIEKDAEPAQTTKQSGGDWASSLPLGKASSHPSKKTALSHDISNRPPVPTWASQASSSRTIAMTPRSSTAPTASVSPSLPINLSISEDERSPKRDAISPLFPRSAGGLGQTALQAAFDDDEEQLYEYFPLSLDDWMPPVDAIYRPHVVHHTIVPPELKAQQVRSRTKRYFSSD